MTTQLYIQELHIKYFQSHKNTVFYFSEGVNAITGTSDVGKSAIIRALKWLLLNRPRGDGFKSFFAKDTDPISVKLVFSDVTVERRKQGDDNKYIVTYKDEKPIEYKALRTDVPLEVYSALKMTDVNLQEQHSPYFLLNNTSGEVASTINEVAGLDIMDACSLEANRVVDEFRKKEKEITVSLSEIDDRINIYSWVDNANIELRYLEDIQKEIIAYQDEDSDLSSLIVTYESLQEDIQKYDYLKEAENFLSKIERIFDKIQKLSADITTLQSLLRSAETMQAEIQNLQRIFLADEQLVTLSKTLVTLSNLQDQETALLSIIEKENLLSHQIFQLSEITASEDRINELLNIKSNIDLLTKEEKHLLDALLAARTIKRDSKSMKNEISELQKTFDSAMKELGVCPLCNNVCPRCHSKIM